MDNFWINKAHKYINEHTSFCDVSNISYIKDSSAAVISANIIVGLPSTFIEQGETILGVRSLEPVEFIFCENFPLDAPAIFLRDDFPRCFPHINPNRTKVSPCIYDGSLSELLQQSEWMNGILNQLVDWLENAASNSLLNYFQGWEPMRNDDPAGFMYYDIDAAVTHLEERNYSILETCYEERNGVLFTSELCNGKKQKKCTALFCISPVRKVINEYIPNLITQLSDLYEYSKNIGIDDLKDKIEEIDKQKRHEDIIIVILAVVRPCKIIGSSINLEFLHFSIHKRKPKKNKKRAITTSKVRMLSHLSSNTPSLLKKLSGAKQNLDEFKNIALVGCGSLGSKIGIHLARNGSGPFVCIDNDIFLPHNNSRHALTFTATQYKSTLLASSISCISKINAIPITSSVLSADFSGSRLIIDSTASFKVRSFLMEKQGIPPVISSALYDYGKCGILLLESKNRKCQLSDLWAHLYLYTLNNQWIREILFNQQKARVSVGQSCSSYTLVVSDAQISLFAASFSLQIQKNIEMGLQENGEIILARSDGFSSLTSETIEVPNSIKIPSICKKNWTIRISSVAANKMQEEALQNQSNETGGVLLGSVFMNAKIIVVTDILPPPPDSQKSPTLFVLGVEGLEKQIKSIERRTCGKVTYLGTWHSHPTRGISSNTDKRTSERLLFVRNYEPTVCLIWTPQDIIEVS